jgi:hypothetical protein
MILQDLYALVPELRCKGLCQDSCGPIGMSDEEWERLGPIETDESLTCPLLKDGRCSRHFERPMICRLWGIDETLACPHGCIPERGHISEQRAMELLRAALRIGGGDYTRTSRQKAASGP